MSDSDDDMRIRLNLLRQEHQDLDLVIAKLGDDPAVDELLLTRMKKRKLQLKDQISRLESRMIPDLNA